jgi:hypothetical protein
MTKEEHSATGMGRSEPITRKPCHSARNILICTPTDRHAEQADITKN